MLDHASSPVTAPGSNTLPSPELPLTPEATGLRRLAFDLAALAVVAGDRDTALRLLEDAR